MTTVHPTGRSDLASFFARSGLYSRRYYPSTSWAHHPILAFEVDRDGDVHVHVLDSHSDVEQSRLADDTVCQQQWPGQHRSDFFHFTLGQARAAIAESANRR